MHSIDGKFVLRHLGQYQQIERLAVANRTAAVAFLLANYLVLDRVAYDRVLIRSNADLQRDIVAWIYGSTGLDVNLTPFAVIANHALDAYHTARAKPSGNLAQKRNFG